MGKLSLKNRKGGPASTAGEKSTTGQRKITGFLQGSQASASSGAATRPFTKLKTTQPAADRRVSPRNAAKLASPVYSRNSSGSKSDREKSAKALFTDKDDFRSHVVPATEGAGVALSHEKINAKRKSLNVSSPETSPVFKKARTDSQQSGNCVLSPQKSENCVISPLKFENRRSSPRKPKMVDHQTKQEKKSPTVLVEKLTKGRNPDDPALDCKDDLCSSILSHYTDNKENKGKENFGGKRDDPCGQKTPGKGKKLANPDQSLDMFALDDDFEYFSPVKVDNDKKVIPLIDFDEWTDDDFTETGCTDPLPLAASFHRHKIREIDDTVHNQLILLLEPEFPPTRNHVSERKAVIKGTWLSTVLNEGDIVHIDSVWENDVTTIDDRSGSLVVNPDLLVSGTAVVSALFCLRKAVLTERFKGGGGGGNGVMLLGTLVHEVFQEVLEKQEYSRNNISEIIDKNLTTPRTIEELAYLGITEPEIRRDLAPFIDHIQFFVRRYLLGHAVAQPEVNSPHKVRRGQERPQWKGRIEKVMDIEENIWSPRLGIKGKIDLTVRVDDGRRKRREVVPLELKTGKPSYSAEHAGQVMLYSMMSSDRREDPEKGLLLYLRSSNMVEIPAGKNEQRGLIQLRNQLVAYLSQQANYQEEEGKVSDLILPEPLNFEKACSKCDYLDVCCLYQSTQDNTPSPPHAMAQLVPHTLHHLQQHHLDWFRHWTNLLSLEAGESRGSASMASLWTTSPAHRETVEAACLASLKLASVEEGTIHTFTRSGGAAVPPLPPHLPPVFSTGEVVVISSLTEFALSQGSVLSADRNEVKVRLDRDLRAGEVGDRQQATYYLDRYTYQGSMSSNYVAVGKLMADSPAAAALRAVIIDRDPPTFKAGLPRSVAVSAREVIRHLNKVQQKAIFRCLMTDRFSLIRGMPGSGKTTTIVGLVRLLARQGQSVLLAAYTNSAVDTLLTKLAADGDTPFLRLGRKSRVSPGLASYTAEEVGRACGGCDELRQVYSGYKVVATTCLATDHAAVVNRRFDWCIVDEASQALLPAVLHPLLHADKFILVGDPAQLPPVVQNRHARRLGLSQTLFDVLDSPSATLDLNIQYRMNSTIAGLANFLTYKGKLECANDSVSSRSLPPCPSGRALTPWLTTCLSPDLGKSAIFLDTCSQAPEVSLAGGVRNDVESQLIIKILQVVVDGVLKQEEVGVMAPYSAQVKHLQSVTREMGLERVEVGTVDQFQGRDRELVIYSCTRSFVKTGEKSKDVTAGHILNDERRLNVAITRARSKLIIVGDLATLRREYQPFQKLATYFTGEKLVSLSPQDFQEIKQEHR